MEKNLGEPAEQREGELVKEEVRGGGEEKLQKLFCPPSYRSGFEKLGKMAKKCAVAIDLGTTYSCVGSFPAWKGLNANKKRRASLRSSLLLVTLTWVVKTLTVVWLITLSMSSSASTRRT